MCKASKLDLSSNVAPTPAPQPSPTPTTVESTQTQEERRRRIVAMRYGMASTYKTAGGAAGIKGTGPDLNTQTIPQQQKAMGA